MAEKKIIQMENGHTCEVMSVLGEGGQGVVYKVKYSEDQKVYALKAYTAKNIPGFFLKNLANNITKGAPNHSFIWPRLLTKPFGKTRNRIGYMMEMYTKEYASMAKLIKGKAVPKNAFIQIKMILELVHAFEALHAKGYSYQDLNDGGVVFDVNQGNIKICDNDNVAPYGQNLGIKGKFKYMAPEVAIGMFLPDKYSDYFSLAVLIFMILLHGDPLEGKMKTSLIALTLEDKERIYGTNPIFVFDINNKDNRPDPIVHKTVINAWEKLPEYIKDLFIKTLTHGLPKDGRDKKEIARDRQLRATEKEWVKGLNKWLGSLVTCPHCGVGTYLDIVDQTIIDRNCTNCKQALNTLLPILDIYKGNLHLYSIILDKNKQLLQTYISDHSSFDSVGTVIPSQRIKDYYAIRNESKSPWSYYVDQQTKVCQDQEIIPTIDDIHINFSSTHEGTIRSHIKFKK
ncbi:MAG: serine/threonine protein kinase [Acholeplasmataceae bacterium]|nr:serine/threonine protein kinase [Acholeplasmataceae bacterium]